MTYSNEITALDELAEFAGYGTPYDMISPLILRPHHVR